MERDIIKMKKLLIMTVAYNEEKNIGEVLEGIEKAVENLHNPNPNLDLNYTRMDSIIQNTFPRRSTWTFQRQLEI